MFLKAAVTQTYVESLSKNRYHFQHRQSTQIISWGCSYLVAVVLGSPPQKKKKIILFKCSFQLIRQISFQL